MVVKKQAVGPGRRLFDICQGHASSMRHFPFDDSGGFDNAAPRHVSIYWLRVRALQLIRVLPRQQCVLLLAQSWSHVGRHTLRVAESSFKRMASSNDS
jgi:hypothetical protein